MLVSNSAGPILNVDLSAIEKNYHHMKSLTGANVSAAAVLKCDAYGLGLQPVGRSLINAGCNFFYVADIEEGKQLRQLDDKINIAVFRGNLIEDSYLYRRYNLIPVIDNVIDFRFVRSSEFFNSYILQIDTGLSRLGLSPQEVTNLYLTGEMKDTSQFAIISHLGCAAQASADINRLQHSRFKAIYDLLEPKSGSLVASAGVWLGSPYHFDMVRLGSALLGLNEANLTPNPLHSVIGLSAEIIDIREISESEAVGYGATFKARRTTKIAVMGIGYKHGLPWSCANNMTVRLDGFEAEVVGRVSMEFTTIDVTHLPSSYCRIGQRASIVDDNFTVGDLASRIGIVPQELLLRMGSGCQRKYTPSLSHPVLPQAMQDTSVFPYPKDINAGDLLHHH